MTTNLTLKGGGLEAQRRSLKPFIAFIQVATQKGIPPNIFILIDTHSDAISGSLQYTSGKAKSSDIAQVNYPFSVLLFASEHDLQILDAFLGKEFLSAVEQANKMGRQLTDSNAIRISSVDLSLLQSAAGGLVGIFMVACGPSMSADLPHLQKCRDLVTKCVIFIPTTKLLLI